MEYHGLVVFAELSHPPEEFVSSLAKKFIKKIKGIEFEQMLVICKFPLLLPWESEAQILEINYLLICNDKRFHFEKISIQKNESLFLKKEGQDEQFADELITVNKNSNFFLLIKEEFYRNTEGAFIFNSDAPFLLEPVHIPKPWGQEIWYTGVEKRGISKIVSPITRISIPLPWFLAAMPRTLLGETYANKDLVLIKVLDPLPDEIYGDLYYELHQQKNEVYVVTQITAVEGKIKIGINKEKLEQYKNNTKELKENFYTAIKKYEVIRKQIDNVLDGHRQAEGIPLNEPISANKTKKWLETISSELKKEELVLRNRMDEFAGYLKLQIGDVINVPILLPHALQHGVRVIEFQTPTYERLIVSFAQKVLTQNHWDTSQAFDLIKLEEPKKTELPCILKNDGCLIEEVCHFPDFYAIRLTLTKEHSLKTQKFYQILHVVKGQGNILINGVLYSIAPSSCYFIPSFKQVIITNNDDLVLLICAPEKL